MVGAVVSADTTDKGVIRLLHIGVDDGAGDIDYLAPAEGCFRIAMARH
ncbi:MAG: hypothetical protein M3132_05150 [Actinomycetia bacterium]|nr:hypothetical protein [Actinomycetes bacterium]